MAVNIHITIIELNALHTKRQNLFQELDAVIHLLMEAKHWGLRKSVDRKSGSAGMPRPISYAVFCLKKKKMTHNPVTEHHTARGMSRTLPYLSDLQREANMRESTEPAGVI